MNGALGQSGAKHATSSSPCHGGSRDIESLWVQGWIQGSEERGRRGFGGGGSDLELTA